MPRPVGVVALLGQSWQARSGGAALTSLLGSRRKVLRKDYATLAEALADNLPKPLQEELASALGIEIHEEPEHDVDLAEHKTEVSPPPEKEPEGFDPLRYLQLVVRPAEGGEPYVTTSLEARMQLAQHWCDAKFRKRYLKVFGAEGT